MNNKDRLQLDTLRQFRRKRPTVRALLVRNLRWHLTALALGASGLGFFHWGGWPSVGWMLFAAAFSAVLRDLRWYGSIAHSWWLSERIIDWTKVDDLCETKDATDRSGCAPGATLNLTLYGRAELPTTSVDDSPLHLSEVALCASPEALRKIAGFLHHCASEMERMGSSYDHIHLSDRLPEFEDSPHLVVARE